MEDSTTYDGTYQSQGRTDPSPRHAHFLRRFRCTPALPSRQPQLGPSRRRVAQFAHLAHIHLEHDDAQKVAVLARFPVARRGRGERLL